MSAGAENMTLTFSSPSSFWGSNPPFKDTHQKSDRCRLWEHDSLPFSASSHRIWKSWIFLCFHSFRNPSALPRTSQKSPHRHFIHSLPCSFRLSFARISFAPFLSLYVRSFVLFSPSEHFFVRSFLSSTFPRPERECSARVRSPRLLEIVLDPPRYWHFLDHCLPASQLVMMFPSTKRQEL